MATGPKNTLLHFSWWNALLLIPLLILIPPIFNYEKPELWGMPFFYWFQFVFVPIGCLCVGIMYHTTKNKGDRS